MDIVEKPTKETTKLVNSLIEEAVINVEVSVVDAPKAAAELEAQVLPLSLQNPCNLPSMEIVKDKPLPC
jgi:hypothetical protein